MEFEWYLNGLLLARLFFLNNYTDTAGNIYQGAMGLDQLFTQRPTYLTPAYTTPVKGLYLCGASTHPGDSVCLFYFFLHYMSSI